jgi:hypothetical protein
MKIRAAILCGVLATNCALAQSGYIHVANSSTSKVANTYSGGFVRSNISVLMYLAPAGTTDEGAFVPSFPAIPVGAGLVINEGRYNGGDRIVSFPPGVVSVQMRAFETNYGNTYEEAFGAGPMNGRRALVGKSAIAQIPLTGYPIPPESTSRCGAFAVDLAGGGPYLSVGDIVVAEGSNGTAAANFKVTLASTQALTVSVDFTTANGSAVSGSDYVATSGTLTFSPGETLKTVTVTLTPDAPVEPDEDFFLNLSNGVNGIITRDQARCVITEVRITSISVDVSLSFNTVAGRHYMVERSADFVTWQPVVGATNILGTGGIVTAVDRGNGCASSVLYRATVLEQ